ncbi:MAG: 50S ribosomal protein L3 [Candidatus Dormibacteria bacterium]
MKALIARKVGMTQVFGQDGTVVPVTVLEAGPCTITAVRTPQKEGYSAVQLGFGELDERRVNQPMLGSFRAAGVAPVRHLVEIRTEGMTDTPGLGDTLRADVFAEGDLVDVVGTSKGKGTAGTVKRHHFHRGPVSHGSHNIRQPGSIGSVDAARVFRGLKMAGRLGNERVTVRGLRVFRADAERNLLLVRGAVPGGKGAILTVSRSIKEVKGHA